MSEVIAEILREANRLRFERPPDALRLYTETAELCRRDGLRPELIRALKGQGQIERDLGRTPESLTHYENAAALCREVSDPLLLAHTLRHVTLYNGCGVAAGAAESLRRLTRLQSLDI